MQTNQSDLQPIAYRIADAARVTGLSSWSIHVAITETRLPARKLGKAWIVLHTDLVQFVNNLEPVSPSQKWIEKRREVRAA